MKSSSSRTSSSRHRNCITQNLFKIVVILIVVGWLAWYWKKLPIQVDRTHVHKAGATMHQHHQAETHHVVAPAQNYSKGIGDEVKQDGDSDREMDHVGQHKDDDRAEDYADLKKEKTAAGTDGDGGDDDDGKEPDGKLDTEKNREFEKKADGKDEDGDDDHDADKHVDGDYADEKEKGGSKNTSRSRTEEGDGEAGETIAKDLSGKQKTGNGDENETAAGKSAETEKTVEKPSKTLTETGTEIKESEKEKKQHQDKVPPEQTETKQGEVGADIKQTGSGNDKTVRDAGFESKESEKEKVNRAKTPSEQAEIRQAETKLTETKPAAAVDADTKQTGSENVKIVRDTGNEQKEMEKETEERDKAPSGRMGIREVVSAAESQQTGSGTRMGAGSNADDTNHPAVVSSKHKRSEGSVADDNFIGDNRGDKLSPNSREVENPSVHMRQQSATERYITVTRNITDSRGLGNQIFELSALIYAAELSDRVPALVDYNVGLLLEKSFDLNVKHLVDTPLLQSSQKYEEPTSNALRYTSDLQEFAQRVKSPDAGRIVLIDGYFQSWKYAAKVEKSLRQQHLVFPPQSKEFAKKFFDDNSPPSWKNEKVVRVGIHVRRGDMLLQHNVGLGYDVPDEAYFKQAMTYFMERHSRVQFVVVSDDISWCRQHIVLGSDAVDTKASLAFSDGTSAVHDMAMLATCDHVIMSVGTFGWWGGWLANGTTIYYSKFPRPGSALAAKFSRDDFFHPRWIGMP